MSFLFRVFTLKKFLHVCAEGNQRTRIFSAVLYMVSKTQRQPKYPSLVGGVCLYSGIVSCNKNELQFQETKQINLKAMLLLLLLLSHFSRVRLYDPIDGSPPGSSIHGIFQATVLEWGAIAFSSKTCKATAKHKRKYESHHGTLKNIQTKYILRNTEESIPKARKRLL